MTANNDLVEDDNKYFGDCIICDQCEWNGIPNQRIIVVYLGIRPTNEPGIIFKFETYDYSQGGIKGIHRHKYDPNVINQLVDQIFERTERMVE